MQTLKNIMTLCNKYMSEVGSDKANTMILNRAAQVVCKFLKIFGVIEGMDDLGFTLGDGDAGGNLEDTLKPYLDMIAEFRDVVRSASMAGKNAKGDDAASAKDDAFKKLLAYCDSLRNSALPATGVWLEDGKGDGAGATWDLLGKDVCQRKLAEQEIGGLQKQINKLEVRVKAIPTEIEKFEGDTKFKTYADQLAVTYVLDTNNTPVTLKDGSEIPKAQLKKLAKGGEAGFLKSKEKALASVSAEIKAACGDDVAKMAAAHIAALTKELKEKEAECAAMTSRWEELKKIAAGGA